MNDNPLYLFGDWFYHTSVAERGDTVDVQQQDVTSVIQRFETRHHMPPPPSPLCKSLPLSSRLHRYLSPYSRPLSGASLTSSSQNRQRDMTQFFFTYTIYSSPNLFPHLP